MIHIPVKDGPGHLFMLCGAAELDADNWIADWDDVDCPACLQALEVVTANFPDVPTMMPFDYDDGFISIGMRFLIESTLGHCSNKMWEDAGSAAQLREAIQAHAEGRHWSFAGCTSCGLKTSATYLCPVCGAHGSVVTPPPWGAANPLI